jgi:hypothetical protein
MSWTHCASAGWLSPVSSSSISKDRGAAPIALHVSSSCWMPKDFSSNSTVLA